MILNYAVGLDVARKTKSNTLSVWPCKLPIGRFSLHLFAKSPEFMTSVNISPKLSKYGYMVVKSKSISVINVFIYSPPTYLNHSPPTYLMWPWHAAFCKNLRTYPHRDRETGWSRPYLWVVDDYDDDWHDMTMWKSCKQKQCLESSGEMWRWKSRLPERWKIYSENIIQYDRLLNWLSDMIYWHIETQLCCSNIWRHINNINNVASCWIKNKSM